MTKFSDSTNPTNIIKWLDEMSSLINKYGLVKLIKSLISLIITVLTFYLMFNFDKAIDWITDYLNTKHQQAIEYRIEIGPHIDKILNEIIFDLGADRAFVFEPHNGKSNVNGLPFGYVTMTYEQTLKGTESVIQEYDDDIDVNKFPFINEVYLNYSWIGTVDELKLIDERMYRKVHSNYTNYISIMSIHGPNTPIGFVGISYKEGNQPADKAKIYKVLGNSAQRIGSLLNGYSNRKK